jgi:SAM-dependent methyltransferase
MAQEVLRVRGKSAADIEKILRANLARFTEEQAAYEGRLRAATASGQDEVMATRATLYSQRGLSSDTSLLPNWGIEDTLLAMRRRGVELAQIRDIAVIGPGLDFADKRDGFDFYPVQTLQPFAVLETAVKLGHRDARVTAFDLNPAVLAHVAGMGQGAAYRIELPRDPEMEWNPAIVEYWKNFGSSIGSPAPAMKPPVALTRLEMRAVALKPEFADRVRGVNLDIIAQTCEDRFDLVVATNILVYYDRLKQAIALANVARMLRPGGVFISNTVLPAQRPPGLKFLGRRSVNYSDAKRYGDDFVVYRKEGS